MLDGNIYYDKVILFEADARNALKAAGEIESNTYVHVKTFETCVLIMIDTDVHKPEYGRTQKDTVKKIINILDKYNISYKIKQLKF